MKRVSIAVASLIALFSSISALADGYAVIDMKRVFTEAPQIKTINDSLQKQFSNRKNAIVKSNDQLQADIKKLERDKAVMSTKDVQALNAKIEKEGSQLREAQMNFQQSLFAAQNEAMKGFMDKVTGVVGKIAQDKKYDMVLPKNDLLYANDKLDITADVLAQLK
jgi:outer membrane protein